MLRSPSPPCVPIDRRWKTTTTDSPLHRVHKRPLCNFLFRLSSLGSHSLGRFWNSLYACGLLTFCGSESLMLRRLNFSYLETHARVPAAAPLSSPLCGWFPANPDTILVLGIYAKLNSLRDALAQQIGAMEPDMPGARPKRKWLSVPVNHGYLPPPPFPTPSHLGTLRVWGSVAILQGKRRLTAVAFSIVVSSCIAPRECSFFILADTCTSCGQRGGMCGPFRRLPCSTPS